MQDPGDAFMDANYHVATRCKHGDVMSSTGSIDDVFFSFFFAISLAPASLIRASVSRYVYEYIS